MNLLDLSKNEDEIIQELAKTSSNVENTATKIRVGGKSVLTPKENKVNTQKLEAIQSKNYSNNYKLLLVNQKILEVLQKIERNMIDEQDTSIKKKSLLKSGGLSSFAMQTKDGGFVQEGASGSLFDDFDVDIDIDRKKPRKPRKDKGKPRKDKGKPQKTKNKPKIKPTSKTKPKLRGKGKGIGKVIGNIAKVGEKVGGKGITKAATGIGKGAAKGAIRAISQGAKLIPGLGLAISAGMAIYDGIQGWQNAGENLGIDEKDLTTTNKISSALGSTVSGLTFGLVDTGDVSKGINNLLGGNKTIEKYEEMGVIEHNTFGDSEIKDWNKISTLPKDEVQKIIDIGDWSENDLQRLNDIKNSQVQPEKVNVQTNEFKKEVVSSKNVGKSSGKVQEIDKTKITANSDSKEFVKLTKSDITSMLEGSTDKFLTARLKVLLITKNVVDSIAASMENTSRKAQEDLFLPKIQEALNKSNELREKNNIFGSRIFLDNALCLMNALKKLKGVDEKSDQLKTSNPSLNKSKQPEIKKTTNVTAFVPGAFNFTGFSFGSSSLVSNFEPFVLKPSDATFSPDDGICALSKKYEVGNGGPGTISSGKGDPGGKSYGSWQLSSNAGTLGGFVKYAPGEIGEQLRRYPLTSPDFDKAWKMIAEQDPNGFEKLQYDYLYNRNFLPVLSHANSLGIDTSLTTIKNVLWSQAIQHGLEGNKKILNNAIAKVGKDAPPEEMINAIYNARSEYVDGLSSMGSSTKQSVLNRYKNEGADALAMLQAEQSGQLKSVKDDTSKQTTEGTTPFNDSQSVQPETNKETTTAQRIDGVEQNIGNTQKATNVLITNNNVQQQQQSDKNLTNDDLTKDEDLNNVFSMKGDDF